MNKTNRLKVNNYALRKEVAAVHVHNEFLLNRCQKAELKHGEDYKLLSESHKRHDECFKVLTCVVDKRDKIAFKLNMSLLLNVVLVLVIAGSSFASKVI